MAGFAATELINRAVDEKMGLKAFLLACVQRWGGVVMTESGELTPCEMSAETELRIQKIGDELRRLDAMSAEERQRYAMELRFQAKEEVRQAAAARETETALLRGLMDAVLAWQPPAGALGAQLKEQALGELTEALRSVSGPCYAAQALQILQEVPALEMLREHEEDLRAQRKMLREHQEERLREDAEMRAFLAALPATLQAA